MAVVGLAEQVERHIGVLNGCAEIKREVHHRVGGGQAFEDFGRTEDIFIVGQRIFREG